MSDFVGYDLIDGSEFSQQALRIGNQLFFGYSHIAPRRLDRDEETENSLPLRIDPGHKHMRQGVEAARERANEIAWQLSEREICASLGAFTTRKPRALNVSVKVL